MLPLGLFTLYAFHRINTVIEEQTYSAAQKAFEDTHTAVEDLLGRLTQVANILTMDPSLYALAASDPADTSYIQRLEDRDRISTTFTYLRSMSGVDRVRLYVSNDYLYTNSADIVSLDTVRNSAWFSTFQNGSAVGWFDPADFADQPEGEQHWYSLMRLIYDPSRVQQPLAILRVDIAADRVDAAVSRSTITQNGTVLLAAASYFLAYRLSQSITRRLYLLNDTMHAVELGDVSARVAPQGRDEIGQLMGSFSNMMGRIDTLMDEKLEQGQQIKALELKALQAQINPHFLYNSLDLINCTAIAHNVPEISRMVNALARFCRLSLSRGKEVIPLADELKHARLYVEIQNMRFEDRVRTEWDVESGVEQCPIIKIVLQPIIENAIIHGIFEKPDKTGNLRIAAFRQGADLVITVEDDGVGMDEETRLANFAASASSANTKGGYGVRNISERLHLAYGAEYGLSCESEIGRGTRVTIRIPATEEAEE